MTIIRLHNDPTSEFCPNKEENKTKLNKRTQLRRLRVLLKQMVKPS